MYASDLAYFGFYSEDHPEDEPYSEEYNWDWWDYSNLDYADHNWEWGEV